MPTATSQRPASTSTLGAVAGSTLLLLLTTLGMLVVALALKSPCLSDYGPGQQPKGCYNDVQTLWDSRDLGDHVFPYQSEVTELPESSRRILHAQLGPGQVEYPVVTGMFIWITALPTDDRTAFFLITALALTPAVIVTALALQRVVGRRALLFVFAPEVAAYAFLNWDALPVAATACAVWAWHRDRNALAGALLAAGASAKLWPGFLLLPLLIHLALDRDARTAMRTLLAAVGTTLALNLPFILTNLDGWAGPLLAQSRRANDTSTNSLWHFVSRGESLSTVNTLSLLAVVVGWAAVVGYGFVRRDRERDYPWLAVGAAMVSSYMLLGRVDSPQYGLWILAFLVVLRVPTVWVVLFMASDMWLWLQWSWLWEWPHSLLPPAQVVRILVLAGLTPVLLTATSALLPRATGAATAARAAAGSPRPQARPRPGSRA